MYHVMLHIQLEEESVKSCMSGESSCLKTDIAKLTIAIDGSRSRKALLPGCWQKNGYFVPGYRRHVSGVALRY